MKFLKFMESSGTLEDKTRLMDIRSISINFGVSQSSSVTTGQPLAAEKPTLNVSVSLNAYFQKPFQKSTPATPDASAQTPAGTPSTS